VLSDVHECREVMRFRAQVGAVAPGQSHRGSPVFTK
jgi:hypothetical protein